MPIHHVPSRDDRSWWGPSLTNLWVPSPLRARLHQSAHHWDGAADWANSPEEDLTPHPTPTGVDEYVTTWERTIIHAVDCRDPLVMPEHPGEHVPTILWSALNDLEHVEARLQTARLDITRRLITAHGLK